jgi:ethanolamine-phosphate cytidylyltransferase
MSGEKRTAEQADDGFAGKRERKPIRVWVDGCYDMMHFGHANSLRQAKAMGDYLIVGVHTDAEIMKHKGPPVMNEQERYKMVRACKWADEVVEGAPYTTSVEFMDKTGCSFCVHGDDLSTLDSGQDSYWEVKEAGKYRECKRTAGISTTDLVGRMLLMTKQHHVPDHPASPMTGLETQHVTVASSGSSNESPYTGVSQFLPTSKKIIQFSEGREPNPGDRIGYIAGAFDLFHVGHVDLLEEAKKHCDFLIVGIHPDTIVNTYMHKNFPIMNLHERVLGVLACKYADEVVIGAPLVVTKDLLDHFKVSVVFHGEHHLDPEAAVDPYKLAKEKGIFHGINLQDAITTEDIVDRIIGNRLKYAERNAKKTAKELKILEEHRRASEQPTTGEHNGTN